MHTCANGEEALRFTAAFEDTIHLLISDVIMPGMNGMALAKVLCEQRSGLRSILMSGYTDHAVTQDGMVDRRIAYLQKRFTPGQLAEKAREVLRTCSRRIVVERSACDNSGSSGSPKQLPILSITAGRSGVVDCKSRDGLPASSLPSAKGKCKLMDTGEVA